MVQFLLWLMVQEFWAQTLRPSIHCFSGLEGKDKWLQGQKSWLFAMCCLLTKFSWCFAAEKLYTEATTFLSFLQRVYTFCLSSTHRWVLLKKYEVANKVILPKSLSDIRWSVRADAVQALTTTVIPNFFSHGALFEAKDSRRAPRIV